MMEPPEYAFRRCYDPLLWDVGHPVMQAFDRLAQEALRWRRKGIGLLPPNSIPEEEKFQASLLEFHAGNGRSAGADLASIRPNAWDDSVSAILYSTAQATAHHILRDQTLDEPAVNSSVHETLLTRLRELVQAYGTACCCLPPGKRLHAGTAKMERTRDNMGADLAIVVGANVLGVPRFRVVLVQAKHADSRRRAYADVGRNEGGQLDNLLSTGMGYYIFYPRVVPYDERRGTRLLPTFRSAPAVFADVATAPSGSNRYMVSCFGSRDGNVDGWGFAEFIALKMAGNDPSVGRLFPCAQSAAASLLVNGKPLVHEVFAADRTGHLSVVEFLDAMKDHGLNDTEDARFPTYEDLEPDHESDTKSSPPIW